MGSNESRASITSPAPATSTTISSSPAFDKGRDLYGGAIELQRDLLALLSRLSNTREDDGGRRDDESDSKAMKNVVRTKEKETHIRSQHILQQASWDCGVACLQMILAYAATSGAARSSSSPSFPPPTRDALVAQVGTDSIWTVDLLFLLQQYVNRTQREVFFTTITPGVCSHYSTLAYYNKGGQFASDRDRVLRLFCAAKNKGLRIYEGRISWESLRDLLCTGRVLIILLVNQKALPSSLPPPPSTVLQSQQQQPPPPVAAPTSITPTFDTSSDTGVTTMMATIPAAAAAPLLSSSLSTTYCGHYILLTGFRPASSSSPSSSSSFFEGFFIYKDPAKPPSSPSSPKGERGRKDRREDGREDDLGGDFLISVAALEEARKAEGTDEDVLVVEV